VFPSFAPLSLRGLKRGRGDSGGGHISPHVTVVADFALLYPLYNWVPRPRRSVALRGPTWIPASAGMTGQVQQDAAEGLGVSPNSPSTWGGGRGAWPCALTKDGPRGLKEGYAAASEDWPSSDANRWLIVHELTLNRSISDSEESAKRGGFKGGRHARRAKEAGHR
jgi:hypothetical protein